jgi:hypothetical protein
MDVTLKFCGFCRLDSEMKLFRKGIL